MICREENLFIVNYGKQNDIYVELCTHAKIVESTISQPVSRLVWQYYLVSAGDLLIFCLQTGQEGYKIEYQPAEGKKPERVVIKEKRSGTVISFSSPVG